MNPAYSALLHTHETLISLYVLFFLVKLIMLLTNSASLEKFRKKTRVIAEMVLPTLFLASGIYLAVVSNAWGETWFLIKLALIIVSIVTGIITFKRNSKVLGIFTFLIFAYIIMLSYRKDPALAKKNSKPEAPAAVIEDPKAPGYDAVKHGAALYIKTGCPACHGTDGALGNHGAADLTKSTLDDAATENVIANGRGSIMAGFSKTLNPEQIHAVAQYVKTLRKP